MFDKAGLSKRTRAVFDRERIICRSIAAWFSFAAIVLFCAGRFTDISFAQYLSFKAVALCIIAFFAVYSAVGMFLDEIHTDSWLLIMSFSVCAVKWLVDYGTPDAPFSYIYEDNVRAFLFLLAVIASYCMIVFYFFRKNSRLINKIRTGSKLCLAFCIFFALFGGGVICAIGCLRYKTFSSPNFDFGIFCQMFHYMKKTGLPLVTCERDVLLSHFAVHLSPICYLLLPFYYVFPSPMTLQIGQGLILFSGIVPVYLLCRHKRMSNKTTILVCFLYSFYPALSCGCLYDFHENCFLAPLLLFMFYFYEKRRWIPTYIFALAVLMVKEDAAVYVVIFAFYIVISNAEYVHGAVLCAVGLCWFFAATKILNVSAQYWSQYYTALAEMPNPQIAGVMVNRYDNLIFDKGQGLISAAKTIVSNPGYAFTQVLNTSSGGIGKLVYFIQMLFPLGLAPFICKKASRWLLIAPILINLLTNYVYQYNTGYQYSFGITAFLFYAAILNIAEMKTDIKRSVLTTAAVFCIFLYGVSIVPSLAGKLYDWVNVKDTYVQIEQLLKELPDDASLNVSSPFAAHLSHHDRVYEIEYHGDATDVDYVVFYCPDMYQNSRNNYLDAGYTVWKELEGEVIILKKGTD